MQIEEGVLLRVELQYDLLMAYHNEIIKYV